MPICTKNTYRILYLPCSLSLDQVFNLDIAYIVLGSIYNFRDINHQYIKVHFGTIVLCFIYYLTMIHIIIFIQTKLFIYLHSKSCIIVMVD